MMNHPDFAGFPEDLLRQAGKLEQHIEWVVRRRGSSRLVAIRDLLVHILQEQHGSQIARVQMAEGLRCEAVEAMWRSKIKDRMDALDRSLQQAMTRIMFLKNAFKQKATEEEYENLTDQLEQVVATEDPYDMGPEIMEELKQIENSYKQPKVPKCDASTQTSPSRPWDLVES